jgi:hypothetical protein
MNTRAINEKLITSAVLDNNIIVMAIDNCMVAIQI